MERRKIGSIPMVPTRLGLGAWVFGGTQWGPQRDTDSHYAIKAAIDAGVTLFDSAQGYGKGHSEEVVGKALQQIRDKVFIATKMFYTPAEKVADSIESSLKRLRTDYIDLFYIHWPKKDADLRGMMEQLVKARERGSIRGIGVSNFSIEQMKDVMAVGRIDAHQLCYNLLWRWDEADLIPFCNQNGISVVTYSSLAQGILTGKFGPVVDFAAGDQRKITTLFDPAVWPHVYEGVEELKALAGQTQRPLTHLAIRWVMAQAGIDSVLVGARNARQAKENIAALEGDIDDEVFERMAGISDRVLGKIPDTGNIFRWYP